VTLWDYNSLQKDLTIKSQPKTESEIIASDSIDDKASALDIPASVKASFLGGMIKARAASIFMTPRSPSNRPGSPFSTKPPPSMNS
ncbi:putative Neoverrucotoxin subunit beta protein, partial [Naja naja]